MFSSLPPIGTWVAQSRAVLPVPTTSFAGQTILLTGAPGALTPLAARTLTDLGAARRIFAVPDIPEDEDAARPQLQRVLGPAHYPRYAANITVWHLDQGSFASVRAAAERASALGRLDVAVMGAAALRTAREAGPDGWETTLQVNHLSCALLSLLLLPLLERSAARHRGTKASVLAVVSSMSAHPSLSALPTPLAEGDTPLLRAVDAVPGYSQQRQQYGVTKLLFLYWLRELMERRKGQGPRAAKVVVQACDFGESSGTTGIATINWEARMFSALFGRPPEMCSRVVVNACIAHEDSEGGLLRDYDFVQFVSPPSFHVLLPSIRTPMLILSLDSPSSWTPRLGRRRKRRYGTRPRKSSVMRRPRRNSCLRTSSHRKPRRVSRSKVFTLVLYLCCLRIALFIIVGSGLDGIRYPKGLTTRYIEVVMEESWRYVYLPLGRLSTASEQPPPVNLRNSARAPVRHAPHESR